MISTDPWIWISAFMTICSFSLLYGENPLFRFGEYTYTSIVIGHSVITGINTLNSRFTPFFSGAKPLLIIPAILGIMSIFVVSRKYAWVASIPISVMIGVGAGLSVRALVMTDMIGNLKTVMTEAGKILVGPPTIQIGYLIRVVFTITGLFYLIFTLFMKGPLSGSLERVRTFGKYVFLTYLAINLGSSLIQTSGLATSAINRLINLWLGL